MDLRLSMAGGYGHDLDVTVAIQAATIRAAIDSWRQWNRRPPGPDAPSAGSERSERGGDNVPR